MAYQPHPEASYVRPHKPINAVWLSAALHGSGALDERGDAGDGGAEAADGGG